MTRQSVPVPSRRFLHPSSPPSELPRPSQALRENTLPSAVRHRAKQVDSAGSGMNVGSSPIRIVFRRPTVTMHVPHSAVLRRGIDLTVALATGDVVRRLRTRVRNEFGPKESSRVDQFGYSSCFRKYQATAGASPTAAIDDGPTDTQSGSSKSGRSSTGRGTRQSSLGKRERHHSGSGAHRKYCRPSSIKVDRRSIQSCARVDAPEDLARLCVGSHEIAVFVRGEDESSARRKRPAHGALSKRKSHLVSPVRGSSAFSIPHFPLIGDTSKDAPPERLALDILGADEKNTSHDSRTAK